MTQGEQRQSPAEAGSAPHSRGPSTELRADRAEVIARQRARRLGFLLMLLSGVVSVLVLYELWSLLMAR